MKKYLSPIMEVRLFDAESIVIVTESSVDALAQWKQTNNGQIVEKNLSAMKNVIEITF